MASLVTEGGTLGLAMSLGHSRMGYAVARGYARGGTPWVCSGGRLAVRPGHCGSPCSGSPACQRVEVEEWERGGLWSVIIGSTESGGETVLLASARVTGKKGYSHCLCHVQRTQSRWSQHYKRKGWGGSWGEGHYPALLPDSHRRPFQ